MTNPQSASISWLKQAVERYEQAIAQIETAKELTADHVLEALIARDGVNAALSERKYETPVQVIKVLRELDERLRKQTKTINKVVKLSDWQAVLNPPKKDWWWNPPTVCDRFDWLWEFLAFVCLAACVPVAINISSRFFSGGLELGLLGIIIPGFSALLVGGTLTRSGRDLIQRMLESFGLPRKLWDEVTFLFSLFILSLLIAAWISLPLLAPYYKAQGDNAYSIGRLALAENNYNLSIRLNPSQSDLHYWLGRVQERSKALDQAIAEYQIAVDQDYKEDSILGNDSYLAYDRLTRLYVLQGVKDLKNYSAAVSLSNEGEQKLYEKICPNLPKGGQRCEVLLTSGLGGIYNQLNSDTKAALDSVYMLRKNRGWAQLKLAQLKQAAFTDAQDTLKSAINLFPEKAAGYCLFAQALEGTEQPKNEQQVKQPQASLQRTQLKIEKPNNNQEALSAWEQCVAYGNLEDPDEAQWISLARKRLKQLYGEVS